MKITLFLLPYQTESDKNGMLVLQKVTFMPYNYFIKQILFCRLSDYKIFPYVCFEVPTFMQLLYD